MSPEDSDFLPAPREVTEPIYDPWNTGEREAVATDDELAMDAETTVSPFQQRRLGAVLGAAIGDALGHPTEFIRSFQAIWDRYGPSGVTGYELYREWEGKRYAPYTDDTQMAEIVLRTLLEAKEAGTPLSLDATMTRMGERFVHWARAPQGGHRHPGGACLAACDALGKGAKWFEAGGERAGGCGSVMRAYPFGLVFSDDVETAERWAVAHSALTHRDPIALAACAAMAVGMCHVLADRPLRFVLSEMVAAACRYDTGTARLLVNAISDAADGVAPTEALDRYLGWAAHEAIAGAVYVFARHPDDPRTALLEAANSPGDSDSLATIVGSLVGARGGIYALPQLWVAALERVDAL
ncbi:MAG: ADP-ribosylglycohydrolase family protein, partial [Myxococcales bacterium]|nr:ADP-ribosylglycohydrolase family protein [Myxococcales bacterium]